MLEKMQGYYVLNGNFSDFIEKIGKVRHYQF